MDASRATRYASHALERSDDSEDDVRPGDVTGPTAHKHVPRIKAGNEHVYEAFNDLHVLAQKFDKPFDAPGILVCGYQTDGKSALMEALIGFQFNHVGGGTKTRRPIAMHMRYNPMCHQPLCTLVKEDFSEVDMSLVDLQSYIQQENARLEAENQFSSQEIIIKVEYKYCPNLTIIDTPGLIAAAPGSANAGLQAASRAIESMVRTKAESPELILLCLEDVNDWSHATTRKLAMQADPNLSRTVLVSTKFDTRIQTFSRPADVEGFLHPTGLGGNLLGSSPFFTSVPAGRVGDDTESVYPTNDLFRKAVTDREAADIKEVEAKLQRRLDMSERSHLGVGQLRNFLEGLLLQRYMEQLPSIVPLLEREQRTVMARLHEARAQLHAVSHGDLKDKGRQMTDDFLVNLSAVLRGNAGASPEKFGETLLDEHSRSGCFTLPSGAVLPVPESLPNATMRLYGGAQFHRTMAEFRLAVGQMTCPELSREEVANACGLEDAHDGANYMRAACVIAVAKARAVFEPFIHQLGVRLSHVLRRMLPAALYMLQQHDAAPSSPWMDALVQVVGNAFNDFIAEVEGSCRSRCLEDLMSTTRYVTWSLHTKTSRSLRAMLSKVKLPGAADTSAINKSSKDKQASDAGSASSGPSAMADLLEHMLFSRQLSSTSEELVGILVAHQFEGIRDFVVQSAELKFNCFFLMPVVDMFPHRLRSYVETLFESDLDTVFHTARIRKQLEGRALSLETELRQVERLQIKFARAQSTLHTEQVDGGEEHVRPADELTPVRMPPSISNTPKKHLALSPQVTAANAPAASKLPASTKVVVTAPAAPRADVDASFMRDTSLKAPGLVKSSSIPSSINAVPSQPPASSSPEMGGTVKKMLRAINPPA